ncbi:MAG TPA: TolC family outer membrane protein, partial [Burkholderiaceae bacterium]|nr:TolC family outer membrane protein [Burkholderiaceae bacterium]
MKLRSRMVLAVALAVAAPAALAQAKNDLLSIYRDALANDAVFAGARATRVAAEERVPQARAGLLPSAAATVGVDREYSSSDAIIPQTGTRVGVSTSNGWGPALSLTVPLYRPQALDSLDQAKLQVVTAEATLAQSRQDLVLRVTQAYFDVLAAEDTVTAIEASKRATAEQLAQAKREFEVGTKTIVDTHEAQARYDQIVAQEQVARGDLIVRQNALRSVIGRDAGSLLPLRDAPQLIPPEPNDMEAWSKRAEEGNPSVTVFRATAQIAGIETERSRHGHYPTLDLVARAGRNQTFGGNPDITSRSGSVGLQVTIPIYSGGFTQSRVRETLALEERARFDLENARRTAAQSARQAFTGANYGLAQVRALESAEVSARSQLDSTRLGYQVGVRINLDVLNAQTQLFNTQRDLKRARYDVLLNGLR